MGSVSATTVFKLNNGTSMPAIGLGTWQAEKGLVGAAVKAALEAGYRHIDCASIYGNQKEVGAALQEVFKSGLVKRADVWITSKLWCTDHDPEEVVEAMDQTLQDLQLDYVDLYLIHWPVRLAKNTLREKLTKNDFLPLDIPATWKAMEKLVEAGKAKAIGVSNFSVKKLNDLLSIAKIPPAVNQVECHPLWQQKKLREFCESKSVHLSGYSPFGSTGKGVLENPVVEEVASRLGRTPAQVALRWGIQSGNSVLPKSTNVDRLKSNLNVFDFEIPAEEFVKFSSLPQNRVLDGSMWVNDATSPYKTTDELWDGEV